MVNNKEMTPKEIEDKRADQVLRCHSYAIDIEDIFKHIFNFKTQMKKLEIDLRTIERSPYHAVESMLNAYSATNPNKRREIYEFLSKHHKVSRMTMYDILSFITSTDEFRGSTYTIDAENGEEYMIQMLDECREIVGYGK